MVTRMKKQARGLFYGGKFCGFEISEYGKEYGYVDYETLGKCVGDRILNNGILDEFEEYWELENGWAYDGEEENWVWSIYQEYIISQAGADFLKKYTDENVFYNCKLNMYVWGITHYGTSWDYVLTDIEIPNKGTEY